MPRPAEYVRSEVLHQAMETFWRKGYAATSMKDLTRATGLQPGSLYGAFESKRGCGEGCLDVVLFEEFENARRAAFDAVLVIGLRRVGADCLAGHGLKLIDRIGGRVAVADAHLSAFFDIDDNRKCKARFTGP